MVILVPSFRLYHPFVSASFRVIVNVTESCVIFELFVGLFIVIVGAVVSVV